MRKKRIIMGFVVVIFLIIFQGLVTAQGKIELRQSYGIKEVLNEYTGKRVSVTLNSGAVFAGILTKVGDHLIHISRLRGKEYFDAMIRIDKISSVVIRAKSDR